MHREMGRDPTAQRFTADHRVVAAEGLECGFRFIPAGFSDVKPATVPI